MQDSVVEEVTDYLLASDEYNEVPYSARGYFNLQGAVRLAAGEVSRREDVSYRDGFNREYGKVFTQYLYSVVHAWINELTEVVGPVRILRYRAQREADKAKDACLCPDYCPIHAW